MIGRRRFGELASTQHAYTCWRRSDHAQTTGVEAKWLLVTRLLGLPLNGRPSGGGEPSPEQVEKRPQALVCA